MNTNDHSESSPGEERPQDHESVADDRLIHGMLECLHEDVENKREDRIDSVLNEIGHTPRAYRANQRRRILMPLIPLASAAVLTFAALAIYMLSPQPTAHAMVTRAIRATQLAPQLRYNITITDPAMHAGEKRLVGAIDMRGEFLLVQIETPQGHDFMMGRDDQGEWSLRLDGSVERFDPRAAAPRWIDFGERTILVGGLDALLEELDDGDFTIKQMDSGEAISPGQYVTQLIATRRKDAARPGPDRIEVWINDDTSLVEKLDLHWNQSSRQQRRHEAPPPRDEVTDQQDRQSPPPKGHRRRHRDHPMVLRDRPQFGGNQHPPPPALIAFQRVPASDLPDEGFAPPTP